jgi:hypothetical protein
VFRFSNQKEKDLITLRAMSVVEFKEIHRPQADDRHNGMGKPISCAENMKRELGRLVCAVSFFDDLNLALHLVFFTSPHKRTSRSAARVLIASLSHYRPYYRAKRLNVQMQGVASVLFELLFRIVEPTAKVL